jgi:hypothetical protein
MGVFFPFVWQLEMARCPGGGPTLNDKIVELAALNNHDDADPVPGYH